MTSKTTNKFSLEVRERAERMVSEQQGEYASRWGAIDSVASMIGCAPQTLHESIKKTEVNSGKWPGVPTETAERLKALERENRELRRWLFQALVDICPRLLDLLGQTLSVVKSRVVLSKYDLRDL